MGSCHGRDETLRRYLAQVIEVLGEGPRMDKFEAVIGSALDGLGLSETDREARRDAILAAAVELVGFSIDTALVVAEVAYRRLSQNRAA